MNLTHATRTILLVSALAAGQPVLSFAAQDNNQPPPPRDGSCGGPHGGPGKQPGGPMFNELNLTAAQREQIQNIQKKQHEETKRQILQILTPEQRTKMQNTQERPQGGMKDQPCGNPPPKPAQ
jgi:Spy/CpxP family protein refolding chaperone